MFFLITYAILFSSRVKNKRPVFISSVAFCSLCIVGIIGYIFLHNLKNTEALSPSISDVIGSPPPPPPMPPLVPSRLPKTPDAVEVDTVAIKKHLAGKQYPAPGQDDPPLLNTHDLADAFLKAPNWKERLKWVYRGAEKDADIAKYYQEWRDFSYDEYSLKLFSMELDPKYGGPFWVYQVGKTNNDDSQSFPIVIREEGGNLKIDWDIFSEFKDRHYVEMIEERLPLPGNFRVVAERVKKFPGEDADSFSEREQYDCFKIIPPYGGYDVFAKYAFAEKKSDVGEELLEKLGMNDDALALILALDRKEFSNGKSHYVITKVIEEGWLRDD